MKLFSFVLPVLLLCFGHGGMAMRKAEISRYQRRAQVDEATDEFGWIQSDELMVSWTEWIALD